MEHKTSKSLLAFLTFTFFTVFFSFAQDSTSTRMADSLTRELPFAKLDTNAVNNLLTLAYYKMNKLDFFGNQKKKELETILDYIKQAEKLNRRLRSVPHQNKIKTFYAWYYFNTDNFEKGREQLMMLVQHYKRAGDIYHQASTWNRLGDLIHYNDLLRMSIKLHAYEQAYNLYKRGGYKLEEIESFRCVADVHYIQGKLDLAEREVLQAISQYRQIGYQKLHYAYDQLASIYGAKNDQKNELRYRLMMIEIMGVSGTIQDRSTLICRVATIYRNLGRYEKAYKYAVEAIDLFKNKDHDSYYYLAVCAAANALGGSGKHSQAFALIIKARREKQISPRALRHINLELGDYYMNLKKYDRAEPYIVNAYSFFRVQDPTFFSKATQVRVYIALAKIKIHQGNFKEAQQFLALANSSPIKDYLLRSSYELASSKVDSAQNRFASSLTHFKKYKEINDSLHNIAKSGQIAQLEIQYETKEREQSIKILRMETLSQRIKLDKVNLQRNITFSALIFLTFVGMISYRFYLYKQKNTKEILRNHEAVESKNKQLEFLLKEKEWLLKEVHHRVKNNLHTIICLLESQAAYLQGESLQAMENSQNRIYTMSLIHQKLYQSEDIKTIDMSVYIPELIQHLKDSFGASSHTIHFNLQIETIGLTQAIAIPVALIINETITNSIKYAFRAGKGGEISISLKEEHQLIIMDLKDNGIGMAKHFEKDSNSLGMQLIKGLTKEIKGDLSITNEPGVNIRITFSRFPLHVLESHDHHPNVKEII